VGSEVGKNMNTKLPRVLVLHTGGTFAMVLDPKQQATKQDKSILAMLHAQVPELSRIAEIELKLISNIDSSDIDSSLWSQLAQTIHNSWEHFDGVVIIHGTDTMAYTASALSFFLAGLTKPVVLTGSQRPLSELRTDARANIIDAVELATTGHPEVMICFDSVVYRGSRVTKRSSEHLHAFASHHTPPLGHFGVHFTVNRGLIKPAVAKPQRHQPSLDTRICEQVFVLDVVPAAPLADELIQALLNNYKGILLRGFGVGNLPLANKSWLHLAEAANKKEIPLVIGSQCQTGTIDLQSYENGRAFARHGAISGQNMSLECMTLKLMVMLGRGVAYDSRHEFFATPLASECGEVLQQ
jgi:L-asparaginase